LTVFSCVQHLTKIVVFQSGLLNVGVESFHKIFLKINDDDKFITKC